MVQKFLLPQWKSNFTYVFERACYSSVFRQLNPQCALTLTYVFWGPWYYYSTFQISPTRCTILLNIFITLLYMFQASMCQSSGGIYCTYATLVFVSLYGWGLVCCLDWVSIKPVDQTPPIQIDKGQCRTDTVISSWWWAHGRLKHVEKCNKYVKENCAPSLTYLQDYTEMDGQQNIKY